MNKSEAINAALIAAHRAQSMECPRTSEAIHDIVRQLNDDRTSFDELVARAPHIDDVSQKNLHFDQQH